MASDLVERLQDEAIALRSIALRTEGLLMSAAYALAEQSRLNAEALAALAIIADMATGPTGHEANLRRQIADVARKAMEGER